MRLRRINSLQASRLARSLRSSIFHSKALRVSESPETLTKRGKIRRVSHRSINKLSVPRDNSTLLDEGRDKDTHAVNQRLTRASHAEDNGSEPVDVPMRKRDGKSKNLLKQWKTSSKDVSKGRKGRRRVKLDELRLQGNVPENGIIKHSDVLADRMLTRLEKSKKKPLFESEVSNIANEQDKAAYGRLNKRPKKLQQARALLMSLRRHKRLPSSLFSKGVTTRHKSYATPQGQPTCEMHKEKQAEQSAKSKEGSEAVVRDSSASLTTDRKLQREISFCEREMLTPLVQEKELLLEEGKSRRQRGSPRIISVGGVQSDSLECKLNKVKKEGSQHAMGRSRRTCNFEGSKQTNQAMLQPEEGCKVEDPRLSESVVMPRQRKRRRISDSSSMQNQHEVAKPRAFISDNSLSERLKQDPPDGSISALKLKGQINNNFFDDVELAAKVAENEIGTSLDVFKIDPSNKSCRVATNPPETGGRQMRPRPLDLEQPLVVLVEGSNQDYYDFDGGSFYRVLQQQPESKFMCSSKLKSHNSRMKTQEVLEKAGSITIPSFHYKTDYEDSLQVSYVLPESYIRASFEDKTCQAEYDMDDEDEEWLKKYNQSASPKSKLSTDQFEKIVDLLENKANGANGLNSISQAVEDNKEQVSEECCICNGGENSANNPVYLCSSCNILVHKSCYGIQGGSRSAQKRKKWKCRKCEAVAEGIVDANASCSLCFKQGGAFKPTTLPDRWAHVVCALYTNETYFVNPDAMEPIDGVKAADMRAKRQKRKCWLCHMREGSAERCSVPACKALFHVSCGVTQGASFVLQHSNHQVTSVRVYCPKHALENARAMAELEDIAQEASDQSSKRRGQRESPRIAGQGLSADCSKDHGESSNLTIGCTEKSLETGEVSDRVAAETAHVALSIDDMRQIGPTSPALMEGIYLYWVSKRTKQGGALLHRIQQEHGAKQFGIFNLDEDEDDDDELDDEEDGRQAPSRASPGSCLIKHNDTGTNMATIGSIANELDHVEAQRILEEERLHLGKQDPSTFCSPADGLKMKGRPLNHKAVRKLCPDHFARETLFKDSKKQSYDTTSLKLSNLQHKGLARALLLRFIQKERRLPKHNEVDLYFVQQCYAQDILKKRVNWKDCGPGLGTAMILPKEHKQILRLLGEGADGSHVETMELLRAKIEGLCLENVELKRELVDIQGKLHAYKQLYGELPQQ